MTPTRTLDLDAITLQGGAHRTPEEGMCAMEAVAYIAGEPHSDSPACASPVIAAFVRQWNDSLDDEARNRLIKPLVPRLVGTRASDATEIRRARMADDWIVREFAPAWLDVAGLVEDAAALRALPEIVDDATLRQAASALRVATHRAAAAWAAAGAAARGAARDAAWDAAGAAARDAAWDAAWAAARGAARDAARGAAWDAAWDAARDAAAGHLAPVVKALQSSALALLDRMIEREAAVRALPLPGDEP